MPFGEAVTSIVSSILGATGTFEGASINVAAILLFGLLVFGGAKLYGALKPKK